MNPLLPFGLLAKQLKEKGECCYRREVFHLIAVALEYGKAFLHQFLKYSLLTKTLSFSHKVVLREENQYGNIQSRVLLEPLEVFLPKA